MNEQISAEQSFQGAQQNWFEISHDAMSAVYINIYACFKKLCFSGLGTKKKICH